MKGYEFRGVKSGKSKNGKEYKSLRFESYDGRACEISCTDSELFPAVDQLIKASVYNLDVRVVSGREYTYVKLVREPLLVDGFVQ